MQSFTASYCIEHRKSCEKTGSMCELIETNPGYIGLTHSMKEAEGGFVPDYGYRYMSCVSVPSLFLFPFQQIDLCSTGEDIPMGLLIPKGFASLLGLKTPAMDGHRPTIPYNIKNDLPENKNHSLLQTNEIYSSEGSTIEYFGSSLSTRSV